MNGALRISQENATSTLDRTRSRQEKIYSLQKITGHVSEPTDKESFGHVLWLILGDKSLKIEEAAKLLRMSPNILRMVIHGRARLTQKFIEDREWRQTFASRSHVAWIEQGDAFERHVATFSLRSGKPSKWPSDKNSFGYVLWKILGGKKIDINQAAARLSVEPIYLKAIIDGTKRPSQQLINIRRWRAVFILDYEAWHQYSVRFEECVKELPVKQGGISREPADANSFGHVLWRILGGKNIDVAEAAHRLGMSSSNLTAVIHGRHNVSQLFIKTKAWREVFVRYYGDAWEKEKTAFANKAAELAPGTISKRQIPRNEESFGYCVWNMIDGQNANFALASKHLRISVKELRNIIFGAQEVTQQFLANNHWRAMFALHYCNNWDKSSENFETAASRLALIEPDKRNLKIDNSVAEWTRASAIFINRIISRAGDDIENIISLASNDDFKNPEVWQRVSGGTATREETIGAIKQICRVYNLPETPSKAFAIAHRLLVAAA